MTTSATRGPGCGRSLRRALGAKARVPTAPHPARPPRARNTDDDPTPGRSHRPTESGRCAVPGRLDPRRARSRPFPARSALGGLDGHQHAHRFRAGEPLPGLGSLWLATPPPPAPAAAPRGPPRRRAQLSSAFLRGSDDQTARTSPGGSAAPAKAPRPANFALAALALLATASAAPLQGDEPSRRSGSWAAPASFAQGEDEESMSSSSSRGRASR